MKKLRMRMLDSFVGRCLRTACNEQRQATCVMERFHNEKGFTTVGVAVALLLVFALLFSSMNSYLIGTRSGQIQYVADAGALAADEAVADFITLGQVVDAMLLSFTLMSITVYLASAVASFIPGGASVATELCTIGKNITKLRDKFAKKAIKALDKAQTVLPALCAAKAMQVIEANANASGIDYSGIAIALPTTGVSYSTVDTSEIDATLTEIESIETEVQGVTEDLNDATETLEQTLEEAYIADCGSSSSDAYCARGRVTALAPSSTYTTYYSSSSKWNFKVFYDRAKAYYKARAAAEKTTSLSSQSEIVQSIARKTWYTYAYDLLCDAYVTSLDTNVYYVEFPEMAYTKSAMKSTTIYTDAKWPCSKNSSGVITLHAYTGCSAYAAGTSCGKYSLKAITQGTVQTCSLCDFSISTISSVTAFTPSQKTGFEYYYKIIAAAAQDYYEAWDKSSDAQDNSKTLYSVLKTFTKQIVQQFQSVRYSPQPPGRYGCICIVVAPAFTASVSSFAASSSTGLRVAMAGATLAPDASTDQSSVITDLAGDIFTGSDVASGLTKKVFKGWSSLLSAYSEGVDGLSEGLTTVLSNIPLVGSTMSNTVSSGLSKIIAKVGLEPADLTAYKPVLCDTQYILQADKEETFAKNLLKLKLATNTVVSTTMSSLVDVLNLINTSSSVSFDYGDDGAILISLSLSSYGLGSKTISITMPFSSTMTSSYAKAMNSLTSALGAAL